MVLPRQMPTQPKEPRLPKMYSKKPQCERGFLLALFNLWYYISMKEVICTICASIGTAFIYLIGGFDVAIQCLLIAIVLDYLSGITKAFIKKELSSEIGFKGILKKVAILLIVMLAVLIDRVTGESGAIRTLVIYYFVANEGLSIIENLGECGLPIPKKLKDALKALKKEGSKKNG